ncbi:MAG: protease HtpX [Nitrospirae bacterium CG18_big_fil_WC_8_21_14_2_50_70_55]|nr:zinc metalloprotease HtpX [Deltaproteobacteria bacterium]OIP66491.1 MAG: protease HtpX [Nitrospirae bacterium CG2_30_70_394]PIQ06912.1 MAG: protease HtpX [Nitrospirae bacterium CG18_big_fil_WC_8_21_14_2_50_70_55]PIU79643.1 MAG: protease HtpX [Nitrospirae bacterium CG06_land_8_20_14_3_00_70_43]PIW83584.1 MAG: protease HtpX [Nitrospirae bacterium CG_4_8_14_3_um_filter_70_85]PIX82995.1 MAG: protease HtpX [Nitrospirae bacterium CG_4_10_14_3_um_filter_70_108]PJB94693.1 MAG: protease HtpX [Nitro
MKNTLRTLLLMSLLTAVLLWAGDALGGRGGALIALVLAGVMNLGSYWFSDKMVIRMYRGREVTGGELVEVVRDLTRRGGLPMPKVYTLPQATPNAFATGRNPAHAAVAATDGLVRMLTRDELMGVMAHELSHVANRDILTGTIAATFAGAISYLATMAQWAALFGGGGRDRDGDSHPFALLAMMIVAPLAAMLIQMAISRSREYQADASGARLCGDPHALAAALKKLESANRQAPMEASQATAHMFIVNPLAGGGLSNLFATHPPMAERIRRLEEMGRG